MARLLLAGTRPENVLCLTYTKAAASEMQNRLFQRLGEWAMMAKPALHKQLVELGTDAAAYTHLTLPTNKSVYTLYIPTLVPD